MFKKAGIKRRRHQTASHDAAITITSPLSAEDREKRRTGESLLIEKITERLRAVDAETDIQELKKLQEMICELKKLDIAADKAEIDRAIAQAALNDAAPDEPREPRTPEEKKRSLQNVIDEIYGLNMRAQSPCETPISLASPANLNGSDQTPSRGDCLEAARHPAPSVFEGDGPS